MNAPPVFSIIDIALFERPVPLRLPFRFGAATVTAAPQAFVQVRIRFPDGREATGATAELMVPKWFDKNPALSHDDNFDQLRRALQIARDAYLGEATPRTAFGHHAAHHLECRLAAERSGLNALTAGFGPAEVDRAVLDALCHALGVSFFAAMRSNAAGFAPAAIAPDLATFDAGRWLAELTPVRSIAARHTVGLADPLTGHPAHAADGLPESLAEVIAAYGHTWFKLKVGADVEAALERLAEIAAVLEPLPRYRVTLDGNEQFADIATLQRFASRLAEHPRLARLRGAIAYFEQPLDRNRTLDSSVAAITPALPWLIDEADATIESFPQAIALGYSGVSSKSCKGIYKALVNRARCARWNAAARAPRYFLSGEDLTTQPGLALQQDLAMAALLGLEHVERNGHHYANGMVGAADSEQRAFALAHPGLYTHAHDAVRLAIRAGRIELASLAGPGFASGANPDWATLTPMPVTVHTAAATATATRPDAHISSSPA